MYVKVAATATVSQADVRALTAASTIRHASVVKAYRSVAPPIVSCSSVGLASFFQFAVIEDMKDSQLPHTKTYRRTNRSAWQIPVQRSLLRSRHHGIGVQREDSRVYVPLINTSRCLSDQDGYGIDSHRNGVNYRRFLARVFTSNVHRVNQIKVTFFHAWRTLRRLTRLLPLSVSDKRRSVTKVGFRPLGSAFTRITLSCVMAFSRRMVIRAALFYRRKFTLCRHVHLILLRSFLSSHVVFHHIFHPVSGHSINHNILLRLFRGSVRVTIQVGFSLADRFARTFPFKGQVTRFVPFSASRPRNFIIPNFLLTIPSRTNDHF